MTRKYLKGREFYMKITCTKCAADFETEKTSGTVYCPYCGSEQTISAPSVQNDDEFFSDEHLSGTYQSVQPTYQPVQPTYQPVQPTYHASFESDAKANKAVKNVFSFAILLLVFGLLRFFTGFLNIGELAELNEGLGSVTNQVAYKALKAYVSLSYTEIVMHVAIVACASAIVALTAKVRKAKFPIADESIFESYKKAFIASCVMLGVLVVYTIVEICGLSVLIELQGLYGEDVFSAGTWAGSFVWTLLLLASGVVCLVSSLKLSKKQN